MSTARTAGAPAATVATQLDARVESATGWTIDALRSTGMHAGEELATVAAAHRALSEAERAVTYHRTQLHRISSGEFDVDQALFTRIHRTVAQLQDAAVHRDARATDLLRTLQPLEEHNREQHVHPGAGLLQSDFAALVALAPGGAVLREHLLTHRMSITTPSGSRITWPVLQRLEAQGLVSRDVTHSLQSGQPITLTDIGRTCLTRRTTPAVRTARAAAAAGVPMTRPHRR
ncbi:hypothetical protein ACFY1P_09325 [Streptomyces sp. NPDC001407]|uniref:hypothetical protein n=1 Tax=Streptomyces sp. NPDC001407 TaxID=3364573 RepID=UPI0036968033